MGPFVFLVLVMIVRSQSVETDDGSPTVGERSDSTMCVCRPHVTINPPVFSRSPPMNSEIGCNSSTIQNIVSMEHTVTRRQLEELQVAVSGNQETVSSELEDTRRKMDELQIAVSGNQETVSSELEDTRRKMDELQVAVSGNQETVSSELDDTRHKVDELQVAVSASQETVSSELEDTRRKMDGLQVAVSTIQEIVTSELKNTTHLFKDTIRQVEELEVTVSGNQETVTSEVRGIRRQLEELQVSVSALVEHLHVALPTDCSEILARGVSRSGVYTVQPLDSGEAFQVYCDMETDGGGWTVFQRRNDGSVDFYLDFASYSRGFGNLEGEFWLGNDYLHRVTAQGEYELHVDLSDFQDESRYATYDSFSIADVSDNYRLTLGSYSGTAGDSLRYQNYRQFSTKDRDNDASSGNCAESYHGAWWYNDCHHSNLNGEYLRGTTTQHAQGVVWLHWKGWYYSLKTTEMKIRPTPQ